MRLSTCPVTKPERIWLTNTVKAVSILLPSKPALSPEHQPISLASCDKVVELDSNLLPNGLQGLEGAVGLQAIVVSFNELSSMEGLTSLTRLTRLDLSFNAIPRIQGLKVAQHMTLVHIPFKCFTLLVLWCTCRVIKACRVRYLQPGQPNLGGTPQ